MLYIFLFLAMGALLAVALFAFLRVQEQKAQIRYLKEALAERDPTKAEDVRRLRDRLQSLERFEGIPDIIERARRSKAEVEVRLEQAERRAQETLRQAAQRAEVILAQAASEGQARARGLTKESEENASKSREALKVAEWQAANALEEARKEARKIAADARKGAREKTQQAEEALDRATKYALEVRQRAEARAREIGDKAYEVRGRLEHYEAAAQAMQNIVSGYGDTYLIPAAHALDELAEEFGFSKAGEKLKLARERTRIMEANGTAATCNYPEGWKRDHALKFVLSTFNGKVDTILARVRPGNQGKLIQEVKDAHALVNKDGEVYREARIREEYLDSRLDELKWAVAVQRLKEKTREEQRAIREQMREEERAKREAEKAIKQAQKEEELVNRAIERVRRQFEQATEAEKARFEAELTELNAKLLVAEEKNEKAISLAQQTKRGHVYVISNIGSFGEDVYKIGLTRRLDPSERVRELGDASVPFPFDVHAMLSSEDAPALETALHKRFLERQVNKLNKRKEFFRVGLQEIKRAVAEMGLVAKWTLTAEASQYRETLALEKAMKADSELKRKWLEDQATFDFAQVPFEEEEALEEVGA